MSFPPFDPNFLPFPVPLLPPLDSAPLNPQQVNGSDTIALPKGDNLLGLDLGLIFPETSTSSLPFSAVAVQPGRSDQENFETGDLADDLQSYLAKGVFNLRPEDFLPPPITNPAHVVLTSEINTPAQPLEQVPAPVAVVPIMENIPQPPDQRPSKRRQTTSDRIIGLKSQEPDVREGQLRPFPETPTINESRKRKRDPELDFEKPPVQAAPPRAVVPFPSDASKVIRQVQLSPCDLEQEFYPDPNQNQWERDKFFQNTQKGENPRQKKRDYSRFSEDLACLIKSLRYLQTTHYPKEKSEKNIFIFQIYESAKKFFTPSCPKDDPDRIEVIRLVNRLSNLKYSGVKKAVFHTQNAKDYISFVKTIESAGYENSFEPPEKTFAPSGFKLSALCCGRKSPVM